MTLTKLCGMAVWACLLPTTVWSQTFTTLTYFSNAEGASPFSSLIQGRDGSLYGTAVNGGAYGYGSIFKVTKSGTVSVLYSFCAETNCSDGAYSLGPLALGADGNLYGTAQNGGAGGFGVLFKVTPAGTYAVIHSFQGTDGSFPDAGLVLGADGNLYGTTSYGGPDASCPCGTIFKASPSGVLTTLHSFDYTDGDGPSADMVQGADGDFFGTTVSGGTSTACDGRGCGTIFKISSQGSFTSLHSFVFSDGGEPFAPLVQASDGALYGVTFEGGDVGFQGCSGGCGTIFKIAPGGLFAIAHKFDPAEGGRVFAGLVQATNGSLYGSDAYEGSAGDIFEFTLPRTLAVVYSFTVASGGGGAAGVLQATDGNLYGTYGAAPGAVFRLEEGLGQFVAFVIPTSKVGGTAQILGQGLAGTTGVTFNGVEATSFNIVSDTYMTAVVPSGATNGPVVVTTPTGPLTSNVNFRVIK